MVDKNDAKNESEPIELIEPTAKDEVIRDDSEADVKLEDLVEPASAGETVEDADVAGEPAVLVEPVEESSDEVDVESASRVTPEETSVAVQTVYITAAVPPKKKGNRGIGTLYATLAAIVFGVVYLGIAALLILFVKPGGVADAVGTFVSGPRFYLPVVIFLVLMVLWVLLANRASWWAWVIGSLVIAVITYLASIGALILMAGGFGLTANDATQLFREHAVNPVLIAAGLLAREVSIWFGAAIASRGRKVRERNTVAREEFEREEAEKRAELGGRTAS